MAVAIRMPDIGTNVEECKLLAWKVEEGTRVKRGQVLAEIETDKAVAELESTAEGVVLRQVVKAGDSARTGDVLAYVGELDEAVPEQTVIEPETNADATGGGILPAPAKAERHYSREAERRSALPGPSPVSPIVRNLATKLGVDLGAVRGTGAGGVITREDVLVASRAGLGEAGRPSAAPATGERLSRVQAAVGRAVLKSWKEIPHIFVSATIDMTAAERIRAEGKTGNQRASYDAVFLKAMARAIEAVPLVAARLDGEVVVRPQGIHIALAVGFGNELFLPVIHDVDQKGLRSLQREIAELIATTRSGSLKAEQMSGGCMALSNLGMYPVDAFEGIIFPGHSAILTIGAAQKKPAVVGDRVEVRPLATVTLAADHRLINGRIAAEFLSKLKETIESGNIAWQAAEE